MMRRWLLFVTLALTVTACGPKLPPNVSIEAKAAIRGTQLVEALRATIPAIKQHVCQPSVPQPCIAPAEAVEVFGVLETAGRTAEELARVLAAVDAARDAASQQVGMERARALLVSISTSLQAALTMPEAAEMRQQLGQTFSVVTQLLFAISTF